MLATPAFALPTDAEVESFTVEIRSRVFIPQQIHLHHGHKTVLRFRNHDTELHTVVAKELFLSDDLNLGGNGAPEFGPEGLKKVIIPPEGLIEFQFTLRVWFAWLIWFVLFIWLIWFIWLVLFNQTNETDQTNQITVFSRWRRRTFSASC
jgi:hypothetical protein